MGDATAFLLTVLAAIVVGWLWRLSQLVRHLSTAVLLLAALVEARDKQIGDLERKYALLRQSDKRPPC